MTILALDQAILETCRATNPAWTHSTTTNNLADLRAEVETTATRFPGVSRAGMRPARMTSCWPLHFLERYFEWAGPGSSPRMAWCRRLKGSVVLGYRIRRIMESGK